MNPCVLRIWNFQAYHHYSTLLHVEPFRPRFCCFLRSSPAYTYTALVETVKIFFYISVHKDHVHELYCWVMWSNGYKISWIVLFEFECMHAVDCLAAEQFDVLSCVHNGNVNIVSWLFLICFTVLTNCPFLGDAMCSKNVKFSCLLLSLWNRSHARSLRYTLLRGQIVAALASSFCSGFAVSPSFVRSFLFGLD